MGNGRIDLNARKREREEKEVGGEINKDLLRSYESLWGKTNETIKEISIEKLSSFVNKKGKRQPFKIRKDKVSQLMASIKDIGITTPLIVRKIEEGNYQILSGHHRYEAAKKLNMATVPCIVRDVSDEEADKYVAECNIQRIKWYPSEYGEVFARYADMRKDLDMTIQEIADKFGISRPLYYIYINVSKCIPEIQEKMDKDLIHIRCADILCSLSEDQQKTVAEMATEDNVITMDVLNEYLGRKNNIEITDIPEATGESEMEEVTTALPISEDTEESLSVEETEDVVLDTEPEINTEKEPVVKREKTQEEIERERRKNGEDIEVSFQYKKDFYNRLNKETEYGLATVCRTDEEVEEYIIKLVRNALNNSNKEVENCISKLIDDALNF